MNEQTCTGDNLTFFCNATNSMSQLQWSVTPSTTSSIGEASDLSGVGLSNIDQRITSTDASVSPNPSSITILHVTAADNGVLVQCRIFDGLRSTEITLSIRELDCLNC